MLKNILRITLLLVGTTLFATPTYDDAVQSAANSFGVEYNLWAKMRQNLNENRSRSKQEIAEWKTVEAKWKILEETVSSK